MSDDSRPTLEARAERLLAELEAASPTERDSRRAEARQLAEEAKSEGIGLCYSRATEFSPRIGALFLAAAKLALIAHDDDTRPAHYERDIARDKEAVAEYERFAALVSAGATGAFGKPGR